MTNRKQLQNTYVIVICALMIIGLICQINVRWYQVVLSAFAFVTAGMLITNLAYLSDEIEDEEEDDNGF